MPVRFLTSAIDWVAFFAQGRFFVDVVGRGVQVVHGPGDHDSLRILLRPLSDSLSGICAPGPHRATRASVNDRLDA